jgi:hypothetical protein
MMIMIMLMGLDYVSELLPPTGLLIITKVLYEHGQPRWNDVDREKTTDSSTRALSQSYQQSSGSKQEERANGMMNLALPLIFVDTCK